MTEACSNYTENLHIINSIPVRSVPRNKKQKRCRQAGQNKNNLISVKLLKTLETLQKTRLGFINTRSVKNKTTSIYDFILENDLDILAIAETWLQEAGDEATVKQMLPEGFLMKHAPRKGQSIESRKGHGGGVGIIYKSKINVTVKESSLTSKFEQFEFMDCCVKMNGQCLRLVVMYRPPPTEENGLRLKKFWREWNKFLEPFVTLKCSFLLVGDMNFHLDEQNLSDVKHFNSTLEEHGFKQFIEEPTHVKGHTLDVLVARENSSIVSDFYVKDPGLCNQQGKFSKDHFAIITSLTVSKPAEVKQTITFRPFKDIDLEYFQLQLGKSLLLKDSYIRNLNVDDLVSLYNETLNNILNEVAPLKTKVICPKPQPWYEGLNLQKQKKRQLERRWRKTKLTVHYEEFKNHLCCLQ